MAGKQIEYDKLWT